MESAYIEVSPHIMNDSKLVITQEIGGSNFGCKFESSGSIFDCRIQSVVKFQITRTGRLANLRLEKPSGIKASDEAALAAVKAAQPFTPLPEGSPQCIDIIFQFDFHNLSQNRGHSK